MMLSFKHMAVSFAVIAGGFSLAGTAQASHVRPSSNAIMPAVSYEVSKEVSQTEIVQYAQKKAKGNVSYAQAKSIARRQIKGSQVVDIALNGQTYRVRLQTQDGRVVDVYVDAATGRVQ